MDLEFVIATNNAHKLQEFKDIFAPYPVKILSLNDLNIKVDPEENGETFKDNSLIKAQAISKFTNKIIIADDSGLEIDALDGFPGIHSSRFMKGKPYLEKFQSIFKMLENKSRDAQFHCVLTVLNLQKEPLFFEGIARGKIATSPSGLSGFGYDPIFIPEHYSQTFAQLTKEEKDSISHRGLALKSFLNYLKSQQIIK